MTDDRNGPDGSNGPSDEPRSESSPEEGAGPEPPDSAGPEFTRDVPDADEITGPLSRAEAETGSDSTLSGAEEFAGIRSPGSNGHEKPLTDETGTTEASHAQTDDDEPAFVEEQQFRQRWVWGMFGFLAVYGLVTVALNPVEPVIGALVLGLPFGGLALLYAATLRTEVRDDGVYLKFFPFHRSYRSIPFEEIVEQEAVEYDPVREYYGWGIRRGLKGWAYNVSGNQGVEIDRTPNLQVLIGSQRPDELEAAIAAGVARADRSLANQGDRSPKWQAVAQFQRDEDLEDVELPGEDDEDDENSEDWF